MSEIDRLTGEVAGIARRSLRQARDVLRNARRKLRERPKDGWLRRHVDTVERTVGHTERLLEQTAQRLSGDRKVPDRMVSLADPDARPDPPGQAAGLHRVRLQGIPRGVIGGFVVVHETQQGNPADVDQIVPAVEKVKGLIRKAPERWRAIAASAETEPQGMGVKRVGIPPQGKPGKGRAEFEGSRSFERKRRWRVGAEARISHLSRGFGMKRTRLRGTDGAKTWTALGIFAYNLHRSAVVA